MKPRQRPDSDFNSSKWNLWPWKHWMTIGIGVLASEGKKVPDRLVLCADTLGSFGDVHSTLSLHKIFVYPKAKVFAVGSHDLTKAGELVAKIAKAVEVQAQTQGFRDYGKIFDAVCISVSEYKSARFRYEIVSQYAIAPEKGWMAEAKRLGLLDRLLKKEWPAHSIDCQVIIGTFAEHESAQLFLVEHNGIVSPVTMPGFSAVGTGATNATFWLAYRDQHLGMGLLRSAYHAYEAKLMAERSPHVGKDDIEMIVASADEHFVLTGDNPERPNCPVSLTNLKEMWKKYGVPRTDDLD
jgi:hypothetical protein